MALPTAKIGGLGPTIHNSKLLIYGPPKVGKTTLAAQLDPDHTLFLATEPGQDALEVYRQPIRSWEEFLTTGRELMKGEHDFKLLVVDTVDELARLCAEHVVTGLAGDRKGFTHASDFEYGKAWDAISQEFRLRVAKLCNLGLGVMFISHVKEAMVKTRTGAEISKLAPDVGQKGMRKWLLGFVDLVAYAHVIQTSDGEQRVLQLQPTENVEAGGRFPQGAPTMPALIPLDADDLKGALEMTAAPVAKTR